MKTALSIFIFMTTCGNTSFAAASDGDLDMTFGDKGRKIVAFDLGSPGADVPAAVQLDGMGRIYLAGHVDAPDNERRIGLARLSPDGATDPGFGAQGRLDHAVSGHRLGRIGGAAMQPDGKLVVAGLARRIESPADDFDFLACRFQVDGDFDMDFGLVETPGCRVVAIEPLAERPDGAESVALLPDGSLVLAGRTTNLQGRSVGALVKLTSSGDLDVEFGENGIVTLAELSRNNPTGNTLLDHVTAGPVGTLVAVGQIGFTPNDSDFLVVRLDAATGLPDLSFGETNGVRTIAFDLSNVFQLHDRARRVVVMADGSSIIAGDVQLGQDSLQMGVVRLDAAGVPDPGFGPDGKRMHVFCDVCINATVAGLQVVNNSLLLSGTISGDPAFFDHDFGVMRLTQTGDIDTSFGQQGRILVPFDLPGTNASDQMTASTFTGSALVVAGHAQASGKLGNRDYVAARVEL